MTPGLSEQSKQLRRHLLNHNAPDVMKWMQESGMADPVGMIIEMTDDIGKQLTYAALEKQGMPRHAIPELIASYCKNAISTFKCVVTFEIAMRVQRLHVRHCREKSFSTTSTRSSIVGGGGNSYARFQFGLSEVVRLRFQRDSNMFADSVATVLGDKVRKTTR